MQLNFLTTDLQAQRSGIEHAMLRRLRLLQAHHCHCRIISVAFNLSLHAIMQAEHLQEHDFLNLYDFFGGNGTQKFSALTPEYVSQLCQAGGYQFKMKTQQQGYVTDHQEILAWLFFTNGLLEQADIYNADNQIIKSERYDTRGWKASETLYDPSMQSVIICERYFNYQGQSFLENYYRMHHGHNQLTKIHLVWQNEQFEFLRQNDFWRFFLDCVIYTSHEPQVMVVDRKELMEATLHTHLPVAKYLYLHSDHVNSHQDTIYGNQAVVGSLNPNYEYGLNNLEQWDGVIMSTTEQAKVFQQRYHDLVPTYVIPVGYVTPAVMQAPQVKWDARQKHHIICVARLDRSKQQDQLIKAFAQVVQQVPDASLDLWGFDYDMQPQLAKLITKLNLQAKVHLCGYRQDLTSVYNQAQLSVLASSNEGFALSLLESIAHGVPVVAYHVPYLFGANAIVKHGVDGYLVPADDIDALAQQIVAVLTNPQLATTLSQNAYQRAQLFTADKVWQQWQAWYRDAQARVADMQLPPHYVPAKYYG